MLNCWRGNLQFKMAIYDLQVGQRSLENNVQKDIVGMY